jgi:hypothetical protein
VARGVVERGARSQAKRDAEAETIETYSAHSVEVDLNRNIQPTYLIEWVSNLPNGFIWTEPSRYNLVETATKSVGVGDTQVCMTRSSKSEGFDRALHLRVSGVDLYAMHSNRHDNDRSSGQILYPTSPDQIFRDKVRKCLSFVLGKPIVYLGHTEFCNEWHPTFMRSVDALTVSGALFKLHDLPPYPINDSRYGNVLDQNLVANLVNALFMEFETIKFNELFWSYWYAVCAPIHTAAVHFGGLIEHLQNNSNRIIKTARGKLLDDDTWKSLNGTIQHWLEEADVPPDIRPILKGKIASLNQAPQNLALKRLLETMGLKVSDIEMKAWKHRNMAAHGGISDDPVDLILNRKILQLLFHRILAGITSCSDRYIDYYNLGHPTRPIFEAVPKR